MVQKRLQEIKRIIQKNKQFEKYAKQYSKDPGSSFKGGDLGWSDLVAFVPEFQEAARESAQSGQIVGPIQSNFGWHLVETVDVREIDVGDKMARNEAFEQVRRSKADKAQTLWLINLRENRHVEIFL